MDIETFNDILIKDPIAPIMGGEPTLHPNFDIILNSLKKENDPFLITNFLFSENVKNLLIKYIQNNSLAFLINASELDVLDRIFIFKKNYNDIYAVLNKKQPFGCDFMPVRITFPIDFNVEEYIKYIDFLHKQVPNISTIRISTACPSNDEQKNINFLGNTIIGENMIKLISFILKLGLNVGVDNILYKCMYSTKDQYLFVKQYNKQDKICGHTFIPTDFLPSGEVIYCYSNSKITIKQNQYKTLSEIENALSNKAQIIKNNIPIPEICSKCKYEKECEKPCLGYFKY